jgi:predicted naringenin-chalcone synthase
LLQTDDVKRDTAVALVLALLALLAIGIAAATLDNPVSGGSGGFGSGTGGGVGDGDGQSQATPTEGDPSTSPGIPGMAEGAISAPAPCIEWLDTLPAKLGLVLGVLLIAGTVAYRTREILFGIMLLPAISFFTYLAFLILTACGTFELNLGGGIGLSGASRGGKMTAPQSSILGLGVASPPALLDQDTAVELAQARCSLTPRQQSWIRRLYRHSGIQRRGSVLVDAERGVAGFEAFFPVPQVPDERGPTTALRLQHYEQQAPPLAEAACRQALEDAATDPAEITHLVCVSCTGMMSPGLDVHLVGRLGLSADIGRLNLGFMGCHGALNGLRTASALAQTCARPRVLVCCVELCSLHFQYGWDTQKIVANGLFADGAGAVVVGEAGGKPEGAWQLVDTASHLTSETADAMTWRIGDHGFEMTLSSAVPKLVRGSLAAWIG